MIFSLYRHFIVLLLPILNTFLHLIVMLIVTQVISQLTILTRRQADAARVTEHQTSALYTLSRQLASTRGVDKLLNIGINYIANVLIARY